MMVTMTIKEFDEYLIDVAKVKIDHPEWRMGQTFFNVLNRRHPELANKVRSTPLDPFHIDDRIGDFLVFIMSHTTL